MECKKVLVFLKDRSRVVNFSGEREELISAIRSEFADQLFSEEKLILQVSKVNRVW